MTFDFGNYDELSDCLAQVLGSTSKRTSLGDYGRKVVYEHFSMQKINDEFEQLYQFIINS